MANNPFTFRKPNSTGGGTLPKAQTTTQTQTAQTPSASPFTFRKPKAAPANVSKSNTSATALPTAIQSVGKQVADAAGNVKRQADQVLTKPAAATPAASRGVLPSAQLPSLTERMALVADPVLNPMSVRMAQRDPEQATRLKNYAERASRPSASDQAAQNVLNAKGMVPGKANLSVELGSYGKVPASLGVYQQERAKLDAAANMTPPQRQQAKSALDAALWSSIAQSEDFKNWDGKGWAQPGDEDYGRSDFWEHYNVHLDPGGEFATDDEERLYRYLVYKANSDPSWRGVEELSPYAFREWWDQNVGQPRAGQKRAEKAKEGGFWPTLGLAVSSGLDQFARGSEKALFPFMDVDTSTPTQYAAQTRRQDLDGLAGVGFDAVNMGSNMLPSIGLSIATGNPNLGLAAMAGSAGGGAMARAQEEGYDALPAAGYGILTGASEAALGKLLGGVTSLGGKALGTTGLLKNAISNIGNAKLRFLAGMAGNTAGEALEEYAQDILDPQFRNIALGEHNRFDPFDPDAMYSALMAAITTPGIEGTTAAFNKAGTLALTRQQETRVGRLLRESNGEDITNTLVLYGAFFPKETDTAKVAATLAGNLESGKKVSDRDLGRLYITMANSKRDAGGTTAPGAETAPTGSEAGQNPLPAASEPSTLPTAPQAATGEKTASMGKAGAVSNTNRTFESRKAPTLEELTAKADIPVVDIRQRPEGRMNEQRAAFRESVEAMDVVGQPIRNDDTGAAVFVTSKTFSHMFSNLGLDQVGAAQKLREIIKSAILTHAEPSRNAPGDNTTGVYTLFGAVQTEAGVQPVKLTVKEYRFVGQDIPKEIKSYFERSGLTLATYAQNYDTKVLELADIKKEGASSSAPTDAAKLAAVKHPSAPSSISVTDLLALVKGDAGKYIPRPSGEATVVPADDDTMDAENLESLMRTFEPKQEPMSDEAWQGLLGESGGGPARGRGRTVEDIAEAAAPSEKKPAPKGPPALDPEGPDESGRTPAMRKLQMEPVSRPITGLGTAVSLRGDAKAKAKTEQALDNALKNGHVDDTARKIFFDIATAESAEDRARATAYAERLGFSKDLVDEIVTLKQAVDSFGNSIDNQKKRTFWAFRGKLDPIIKTAKNWKPPSVLSMNANIMQRTIERMMDPVTAQAVNTEIFDPIFENAAKRRRWVNTMYDQVRGFKLNKAESEACQQLMEEKVTVEGLKAKGLDGDRISAAAKVMGDIYAQLYDAINDMLVTHGYSEIGWQRNYAPHMQKEAETSKLQTVLQRLGFPATVSELPVDIAGRTDVFRPGKQYVPFFEHRVGGKVVYDAVGGFEKYINYVSNVLYHMDDIQKLRCFEQTVREMCGADEISARIDQLNNFDGALDEDYRKMAGLADPETQKEELYNQLRDTTKLGGFVSVLNDYTNILAGKQTIVDRGPEHRLGRIVLNFGNKMQSVFSKAAVVGNISSAINQTVQLPMLMAEVKQKYIYSALLDILGKRGDIYNLYQQSSFLAGKTGIDALVKSGKDHFFGALSKPFEIVDDFASRLTVRSKYLEQIDMGASHEEALRTADLFASRLLGNRMEGMRPLFFEDKNFIEKLVTTFQLEVANTFEHVKHDLPREIQDIAKTKGVGAAAQRVTRLVVVGSIAAFIGNLILKQLTGREPVPYDGIGMVLDYLSSGYGMSKEDYMRSLVDDAGEAALGSRPFQTERDKGSFDYGKALPTALGDIVEDVPYVNNITNAMGYTDGRLPLPRFWDDQIGEGGAALLAGSEDETPEERDARVWGALQDMSTGALNVVSSWIPTGNQAKKSLQGWDALRRGGSYYGSGDNKRLQYPVQTTPFNVVRGVIFGKSALPTASEYYDTGAKPLSAKQTEKYETLVAGGMDKMEAWDLMRSGDTEKIDASYRDANLRVNGAEDTLKKEGEEVYEKAQKAVALGASFESYYEAYMQLKGKTTTWEKEQALREVDTPEAERNAIFATMQGQSTYLKFKHAGLAMEDAQKAAWAVDTLLPSYGRNSVSNAQKWRAVLNCGIAQDDAVSALGAIMDETQNRKFVTSVDFGLSPTVYVTFKELMGKESSQSQDATERVLDTMVLDQKQKAVLWQLQNSTWKAKNNPYNPTVGRQVVEIYEGKK